MDFFCKGHFYSFPVAFVYAFTRSSFRCDRFQVFSQKYSSKNCSFFKGECNHHPQLSIPNLNFGNQILCFRFISLLGFLFCRIYLIFLSPDSSSCILVCSNETSLHRKLLTAVQLSHLLGLQTKPVFIPGFCLLSLSLGQHSLPILYHIEP